MIQQLLVFAILLLSACSSTSASSYPTVKVISIGDGDTITVRENDSKTTIKLACIDAPESSQQGSQESTNYLKKLIPVGTTNQSNLPSCVESDCNCSDFSNQQEAQRVLEAFDGDPHRLDGDGNGVACESLP